MFMISLELIIQGNLGSLPTIDFLDIYIQRLPDQHTSATLPTTVTTVLQHGAYGSVSVNILLQDESV